MSALDFGAMSGMAGDAAPQPPDPLTALQDAIHAVTACLLAVTDPQDNSDVANALGTLARVQARMMKAAPGGPAQT